MKKGTVLLNTEALANDPLSHEYFHGKVQKPQERHHEVVGSGQWQTYDYPRRNKEAVYHADSGRICGHHGRSQRHHAESF